MQKKSNNFIERAPVIAIMGHIDHGKSTLLDYIRKSNIVDTEAGGITQRISAYEVNHRGQDGKNHAITFLDTPGHEAFSAIRSRGASVADIAVLVIAADDGVKPQTTEALKTIIAAKIPYIIALNKIDKDGVNIEALKANLAEHEMYVEGYGGDIPYVGISAKTGQGIPELLDMMLLVAELGELKGNTTQQAEGIIIEANVDKQRGIAATVVIKNGTLKTGEVIVAGSAFSATRMIKNFLGKPIKEATFSSPVQIIGWNELPHVGSIIKTFSSKKEAESFILNQNSNKKTELRPDRNSEEQAIIPIIIKAQEAGGLEAVEHELQKIKSDKISIKVIQSGVGDIGENDIKLAGAREKTIVLGFNVKVDGRARTIAEKLNIEIQVFDIIYKLSEWLQQTVIDRTPKEQVEESTGKAKVVRLFSKIKDRQILGGRVETGLLLLGAEVNIIRRDFQIGKGRIRELQRQKNKAQEVPEGQEFGAMVESKIEIAPGDRIEAFKVVEK